MPDNQVVASSEALVRISGQMKHEGATIIEKPCSGQLNSLVHISEYSRYYWLSVLNASL
jgi:hypothetical protein